MYMREFTMLDVTWRAKKPQPQLELYNLSSTSMMPLDRPLAAAETAAIITFPVHPATKDDIALPPGPPAYWFWETAFVRLN
ncbi:hypothetical protein BU15DRAFT_79350 [Melanogaster broomeanus]|nr:hypothetical protein BU15DRAFT_79350 [Melanogaster broomeanus]